MGDKRKMTKEELEKEVEEYLENEHCKNVCACDEVEECKKVYE